MPRELVDRASLSGQNYGWRIEDISIRVDRVSLKATNEVAANFKLHPRYASPCKLTNMKLDSRCR